MSSTVVNLFRYIGKLIHLNLPCLLCKMGMIPATLQGHYHDIPSIRSLVTSQTADPFASWQAPTSPFLGLTANGTFLANHSQLFCEKSPPSEGSPSMWQSTLSKALRLLHGLSLCGLPLTPLPQEASSFLREGGVLFP